MEKGHNQQRTYRALLDAMSRPGRVVRINTLQEASLSSAVLAIGRCLLDHEVSLAVVGGDIACALRTELVEATQVRSETPEKADFLLIDGSRIQGVIARARRGTMACPEEGATVIYCLESKPATTSDRLRVRLMGPGIAAPEGIMPEMAGVEVSEYETLMSVNADYPLGVDAIFVRADGDLMALPRSTRIQVR